MKKLFVFASLLFIGTALHAQNNALVGPFRQVDVPTNVVKAIERDFPETKTIEFDGVMVEILDDHWYVSPSKTFEAKDYDAYIIILDSKGLKIEATYNDTGKLLHKTEFRRDVSLPPSLAAALDTNFPGWKLDKDHEVINIYEGGKTKVHFALKLTDKKGKTHRIVFNEEGGIIKGKPKNTEMDM